MAKGVDCGVSYRSGGYGLVKRPSGQSRTPDGASAVPRDQSAIGSARLRGGDPIVGQARTLSSVLSRGVSYSAAATMPDQVCLTVEPRTHRWLEAGYSDRSEAGPNMV